MQKVTKYICSILKQAAKMTTLPFNVYAKDDKGDVVTDVDKQVEEFVVDKLNQKFPEFDIVSEEFNPNQELTDNCFIIDPIDGTANFSAGLPLWGMQIAGRKDGEMFVSVIYLPTFDQMYYADCDGAFMNGKKLEIATNESVKYPIYDLEGGDKFTALMQLEKTLGRRFRFISASSVGYAWVAAGFMNAFMLRKDTKWDYLPGLYLVKMAGGCTLDEPGAHIAASNNEILTELKKHKLASK